MSATVTDIATKRTRRTATRTTTATLRSLIALDRAVLDNWRLAFTQPVLFLDMLLAAATSPQR